MKLSFFLNHRNIGWSIASERLIASGVRNINLTPDEYNEFQRGLAQSTNKVRTEKRTARVNRRRFKQRREELRQYLIDNLNYVEIELSDKDLWQKRAEAANIAIPINDLCRVLMHLNGKRGYRAADIDADLNENSEYLVNLEANTKELHDSGLTIGQFLFKRYDEGLATKRILFKREDYQAEYWAMMNNQELPDEVKQKIFDIVYFQRPLKSQKHRVSFCDYTDKRVAHRSNPYFQRFKILSEVANIKVYDAHGRDLPIEENKYQALIDALMTKDKLTKLQILALLGFKRTDKVMLNYEQGLSGHTTNAAILKAVPDYNINRPDAYFIWHLIYSVPDKIEKAKVLTSKYNFSEAEAEALSEISFNKLGYSDLSEKAIKMLLPHLESGKHLTEAIKLTFKKRKKNLTTLPEAKLFKKNALRSVVLEKASNALLNQFNELIKSYDISEVYIEFDRLMLMSKKGRQSAAKTARSRKSENDKIREELRELGIEVNGNGLIKYKLWQEMNGFSPYEPFKQISIQELFDKSDPYEIEHIIPYSRLFDSSLHNKTVCRRSINEAKDDLTANEFMSKQSQEIYDKYLALIEESKISRTKRKYFMSDSEDISTDYIFKRLNIESWYAKALREAIEITGRKVYFNDFIITNHLRDIWGLRNEQVSPEPDDDLRLLAVSAIIGAFTADDIKSQLNDLNKNYFQAKSNKVSLRNFAQPYPEFKQDVLNAFNQTIIRYKVGDRLFTKDKNGHANPRTQLHLETVYGKVKVGEKNEYGELRYNEHYVVKYPLSSIAEKDLPYIYDNAIREIITERLRQFGNNAELCWGKLDEMPLLDFNGKVIRSVRLKTGMQKVRALRRFNGKEIDFVSEANNHHMAIYKDHNGKLHNIEVSALTAIQRKNAGMPIIIKEPREAIDYASQHSVYLDDKVFWEQMPLAHWQYVTHYQKRQLLDIDGEIYRIHSFSQGKLILLKHFHQDTTDPNKMWRFTQSQLTLLDGDAKIPKYTLHADKIGLISMFGDMA